MRIGIIILIIIGALGAFFFWNQYTIFVQFDNAKNVMPKTPVYMNGVIIGKVSDIKINQDKVIFKLTFNRQLKEKLPDDSIIFINTRNEQNIVEIERGSSNIFIENGQTVRGLSGFLGGLKEIEKAIKSFIEY